MQCLLRVCVCVCVCVFVGGVEVTLLCEFQDALVKCLFQKQRTFRTTVCEARTTSPRPLSPESLLFATGTASWMGFYSSCHRQFPRRRPRPVELPAPGACASDRALQGAARLPCISHSDVSSPCPLRSVLRPHLHSSPVPSPRPSLLPGSSAAPRERARRWHKKLPLSRGVLRGACPESCRAFWRVCER